MVIIMIVIIIIMVIIMIVIIMIVIIMMKNVDINKYYNFDFIKKKTTTFFA